MASDATNDGIIDNSDKSFILIFGVAGSGKSSFIREVVGSDNFPGHIEPRHNSQPEGYAVRIGDETIVMVDTPGMDLSVDILQDIEDWMGKNAVSLYRIRGIVFLHPITFNRINMDTIRRILEKFVGDETDPGTSFERVALVTSKWSDDISAPIQELRNQRHTSLEEGPWKSLLKKGAVIYRYSEHPRYSAAQDIIRSILAVPSSPDAERRLQTRRLGPTSSKQLPANVTKLRNPGILWLWPALRRYYASKSIVLLLGPTGSGKSKFIEHAAGLAKGTVPIWSKEKLEPCTKELGVYESTLYSGLVLIDTPGYDISGRNPETVLNLVRRWFKIQNLGGLRRSVSLTSVLLFHHATANISADTGGYLKAFMQNHNILFITTYFPGDEEDNARGDFTKFWEAQRRGISGAGGGYGTNTTEVFRLGDDSGEQQQARTIISKLLAVKCIPNAGHKIPKSLPVYVPDRPKSIPPPQSPMSSQ